MLANDRTRRSGFTVVELLVSAAVGGILLLAVATAMVEGDKAVTRFTDVSDTRTERLVLQNELSTLLARSLPGQIWWNAEVGQALGLNWIPQSSVGGALLVRHDVRLDTANGVALVDAPGSDVLVSVERDASAPLFRLSSTSMTLLSNQTTADLEVEGVEAATVLHPGELLGMKTQVGTQFLKVTAVSAAPTGGRSVISIATLGRYDFGTLSGANAVTLPARYLMAGMTLFRPRLFVVGMPSGSGAVVFQERNAQGQAVSSRTSSLRIGGFQVRDLAQAAPDWKPFEMQRNPYSLFVQVLGPRLTEGAQGLRNYDFELKL
jgi:prepilin-type N-terminal cleavage/methylation domain-containing protein